MSPSRILGFCYLATISLLALAVASADQARLSAILDGAGATVYRRLDENVWRSIRELARWVDARLFDPPRQYAVLDLAPLQPGEDRTYARTRLPPVASRRLIDQKFAEDKSAPSPPLLTIAPDLPSFEKDVPTFAEKKVAVQNEVRARLERRLSPDLRANFDLFLYVSTAAAGPAAQRLYVFRKDDRGGLVLLYDWAASTGRAALETSPQGRRVFTATPQGLYQFDPARFYRRYFSRAWNGNMPFAMFLDGERHGEKSGVAVHAATGKGIARLGERTSAGCIHLSPRHAELLFKLIRSDYKGKVPRFAFDASSRTSSDHGDLMHDALGNLVRADGYRVLIDIEDFSGSDVLAALL